MPRKVAPLAPASASAALDSRSSDGETLRLVESIRPYLPPGVTVWHTAGRICLVDGNGFERPVRSLRAARSALHEYELHHTFCPAAVKGLRQERCPPQSRQMRTRHAGHLGGTPIDRRHSGPAPKSEIRERRNASAELIELSPRDPCDFQDPPVDCRQSNLLAHQTPGPKLTTPVPRDDHG